MQKSTLCASIINSVIGICSSVIYLILVNYEIVEYRSMFPLLLIGFFAVVWLPMFLTLIFKMKLELFVNISYQSFMVLSILMGSICGLYDLFAFFDTFVHGLSGVLIAIIAYSFIRNSKSIKMGSFWLFVILFSIVMMCGGLWEIWEFVTDSIMDGNSQRTVGLIGREAVMDTMIDILCDAIGGVIGSVICLIAYNKSCNKNKTPTDAH